MNSQPYQVKTRGNRTPKTSWNARTRQDCLSEARVLSRKKGVVPSLGQGDFAPSGEVPVPQGLFTSEGKMEQEIERRISVASAIMRILYRSIEVKAKFSIYWSILHRCE